MKHVIDVCEMDREMAILLFDNAIHEDSCNHQYILQDILSSKEIELDAEDTEACKDLEIKYGMCAIDCFVDDSECYLLIQSLEYLKFASIELLETLWNKYNQCKIGVFNNAFDSLVTVYDSFEEFKSIFISTLKSLETGTFILVDIDNEENLLVLDTTSNEIDKITVAECKGYLALGLVVQGVNNTNPHDVTCTVQKHYKNLLDYEDYKYNF